VEWKSGPYNGSSFVKLRYMHRLKMTSISIIAGPSDWEVIQDILRRGNASIVVIGSHYRR
jgi:hypothetical protein